MDTDMVDTTSAWAAADLDMNTDKDVQMDTDKDSLPHAGQGQAAPSNGLEAAAAS
jgi:hypothetical protein